jgi:hypothetical protein
VFHFKKYYNPTPGLSTKNLIPVRYQALLEEEWAAIFILKKSFRQPYTQGQEIDIFQVFHIINQPTVD